MNLYHKMVEDYKVSICCTGCNGEGRLATSELFRVGRQEQINRYTKVCEECGGNGVPKAILLGK